MKMFTNKNIVQKIIIAIVIVMLFNFCVPMTTVHAGIVSDIGGIMKDAIVNLVATIFDAVNYGLQMIMLR